MTIDFGEWQVSWHSDVQLVGSVSFPDQLKYSELYFVLGIRDKGVAIELLAE